MLKKYIPLSLRCTPCVLPALFGMLLAVSGSNAGTVDKAEELGAQCPGASAWYRAHPEEDLSALLKRDAARSFSEPQLRTELAARYERDQAARKAILAAPHDARLSRRAAEVDRENVAWLWKIVSRTGFPDAEQVGEAGVHHAWLLAQHADTQPRFQAALLPVLEQRHADKQLAGTTLSRFVDRVLVAQHQSQRYGTQFSTVDWATPHFGLSDEEQVREVDRNRQALGIMPLADYVCMMSYARKRK